MAQLDQLVPLFDQMTDAEQREVVAAYRRKRDIDLESSVPFKQAKPAKDSDNVKLTPEQNALLKKLGISKRDLLRLIGGVDGQ